MQERNNVHPITRSQFSRWPFLKRLMSVGDTSAVLSVSAFWKTNGFADTPGLIMFSSFFAQKWSLPPNVFGVGRDICKSTYLNELRRFCFDLFFWLSSDFFESKYCQKKHKCSQTFDQISQELGGPPGHRGVAAGSPMHFSFTKSFIKTIHVVLSGKVNPPPEKNILSTFWCVSNLNKIK